MYQWVVRGKKSDINKTFLNLATTDIFELNYGMPCNRSMCCDMTQTDWHFLLVNVQVLIQGSLYFIALPCEVGKATLLSLLCVVYLSCLHLQLRHNRNACFICIGQALMQYLNCIKNLSKLKFAVFWIEVLAQSSS